MRTSLGVVRMQQRWQGRCLLGPPVMLGLHQFRPAAGAAIWTRQIRLQRSGQAVSDKSRIARQDA